MKNSRVVLFGLGTVNIGLLKILKNKKADILNKYGINFTIVGVCDSSGFAMNDHGFPYSELIDLKANKGKVKELPGYVSGKLSEEIVHSIENADLLIDSSVGNIKTGSPGLEVCKNALAKGCSVVLANKTPLIFAFDELHKLAKDNNCKIAYSATVCGGLPVINVLQRDLKEASLKSFKGILNATTNYILQKMNKGGSMEDAIIEAQRIGAAEADPTYDTHGYDTANKLFIIMKSFTGFNGSIKDISTEGIQFISRDKIEEAKRRGNKIKLLAMAVPSKDGWKLSVRPQEVSNTSFLGTTNGWEMGIELESDLYESVAMKNYEADPVGTSAAVLRDMIDVVSSY